MMVNFYRRAFLASVMVLVVFINANSMDNIPVEQKEPSYTSSSTQTSDFITPKSCRERDLYNLRFQNESLNNQTIPQKEQDTEALMFFLNTSIKMLTKEKNENIELKEENMELKKENMKLKNGINQINSLTNPEVLKQLFSQKCKK